ncbi:MAG: T9SS type A sorting domain-containing protein, partial [Chitinophagaceae bacterium]
TLSLDNYYGMLQQTGNKGLIVVNYGYARYGRANDPVAAAAHLAADWVRYDNGRTKFWEVGNECFGSWEAGYRIDRSKNKDGQPEFITGALYGQHFKVFADSMKAAAQQIGATIYIGAILLEHAPANWEDATAQSWNSGVIPQVTSKADFYIVHSYYTPYNTNSSASEILGTATSVTQGMMNYVTQNVQANGGAAKPIALTEFNIFAVGSMQQVSHINGMHAAITTGELMKTKFGQATRWDLANGWDNGNDHGMFSQGDEPGIPKWNPRPDFYHLYYFGKYCGDHLVNSSVAGSPDVLSYATLFSSGQAGIMLFNKGLGNQIVKVNFQNFPVGARYYWYSLSGSNDNGEFSRKVLVNGKAPTNATGGPLDYATLKPDAAVSNDDVKITVPGRSAVYMLVERNMTVTATNDIDPTDRIVQVLNNPSTDGSFTLKLNGFTAADKFAMSLIDATGKLIYSKNFTWSPFVRFDKQLAPGMYGIKIQTKRGVTTKKLIVW